MEQDQVLKKFGEIVKEARLSKGLTQLELADKFSSAEATISRLEKGKMNPSLTWILKLSEALGINPSELLDHMKWRQNKEWRPTFRAGYVDDDSKG